MRSLDGVSCLAGQEDELRDEAGVVRPDYTIRYPQMPNEADPDPTAWKETIARELRTLSDGVFLVEHSVGAAILMDYLASGTEDRRLARCLLRHSGMQRSAVWTVATISSPTTYLSSRTISGRNEGSEHGKHGSWTLNYWFERDRPG